MIGPGAAISRRRVHRASPRASRARRHVSLPSPPERSRSSFRTQERQTTHSRRSSATAPLGVFAGRSGGAHLRETLPGRERQAGSSPPEQRPAQLDKATASPRPRPAAPTTPVASVAPGWLQAVERNSRAGEQLQPMIKATIAHRLGIRNLTTPNRAPRARPIERR